MATLHTDASELGWGTVLQIPQGSQLLAQGFWTTRERHWHINVKELTAVERAIQSFAQPLLHCWVNLYVDSRVVLGVLHKLTSPSIPLMDALRTLFYLLETYRVTLQPAWLPTFENVMADYLSRHTDTEDWALNQRIFDQLNRRWGPLTIDKFATTENRLIPKFNSRWHCPLTHGIDAFAQDDWERERNWCNPPFSQLSRLTSLLESLPGAYAVVIATFWPGSSWFRRLLDLSTEHQVFRPSQKFFAAGRLGGLPTGAAHWRTIALKIPPWTPSTSIPK